MAYSDGRKIEPSWTQLGECTVIGLVDDALFCAVKMGAQRVTFESEREAGVVRIWKGLNHIELFRFPNDMKKATQSRLKIMADLNISLDEKLVGHMTNTVDGQHISFKVTAGRWDDQLLAEVVLNIK